MQNPSPCTGAVGPDGQDRAHCQTCQRFNPAATGWVLTGKTFRHAWLGNVEIVECLDRLPLEHAPSVAPVTLNVCGADASRVTLRKRALSWLLAAGAVTIAVAAAIYSAPVHAATGAAAQCGPWNPATDPYQGDHGEAVMRLTEIPDAERRVLADMVRQQYGWQRVMVNSSGIVGADLADLRSMNFGSGRICAGAVNRSTWPAGRHESAKAYTVGRWSVLVFDSCRNVALATNAAALPPARPYTPADVRAGYRGGLGSLGLPSMTVPEPGGLALGVIAFVAALAIRRQGPKA